MVEKKTLNLEAAMDTLIAQATAKREARIAAGQATNHDMWLHWEDELKKHPFNLEALVPTDQPTACVLPSDFSWYLPRILEEKNIPYTLYECIGDNPTGLSVDDAITQMKDLLGANYGITIWLLPFTRESVDAYLKGYINPSKDEFWTAFHEYLKYKKIFDEAHDRQYNDR